MASEAHEYVALSAYKAGGREYERGDPVDDGMEDFFILTDLSPQRAAHRATPAGRAAILDKERREIEATEAARREAEEEGIDLREVEGTGEDGRVTVRDIEREVREQKEERERARHQALNDPELVPPAVPGQEPEPPADPPVGDGGHGGRDGGQREDPGDGVEKTAVEVQPDGTEHEPTNEGGEGTDENPFASEAAAKRAEEAGLSPAEVEGTGSGGKITVRDVERTTKPTSG